MVRLALACEYQRRPIRRADVTEKVLGNGAGRRFKGVFNGAQVELRSIFGMEMVELPSKEKVTVAQKRAAHKASNTQGAAKGTASWILISVLPAAYRSPEVLHPSAAPTSSEEASCTSLYTLIVSLIMLSGGQLPDAKMERYLRRLTIEDNAPFGAPGGGIDKTEKVLKRIEKDGYIVKIRESSGPSGEDDVFWIVGPRGKVEVGETGVEGLVRAVHGDLDTNAENELSRRIGRSLGLGEEKSNSETQATSNGKKRGRRKRGEQEQTEQGSGAEESSDDE